MNILITGIHGFVGSNLVKALSAGNTIYGVDIVDHPSQFIAKTYRWEDLDAGQVPPVEAIIHLAGKAHETKKQSDAEVYFQVNTGLTQQIFDYFLASGAHKFIFFSSVKAAADTVEGEVLTEDVTPKPVGPYGESKIKAEQYIKSHFDFDSSSDKRVYILRPCMIHGPGNKGNLNLLYQVVKMGVPYPLGKFDNLRTFTSIDNVSFIIQGLLAQEVASGIYNLADDDALPTTELIKIISSTLGKKARIWNTPKWMVRLCARMGDVLPIPLNSERLHKMTDNYMASNAKIKQALCIDQLPVKATDGLRKTIQNFEQAATHHTET